MLFIVSRLIHKIKWENCSVVKTLYINNSRAIHSLPTCNCASVWLTRLIFYFNHALKFHFAWISKSCMDLVKNGRKWKRLLSINKDDSDMFSLRSWRRSKPQFFKRIGYLIDSIFVHRNILKYRIKTVKKWV